MTREQRLRITMAVVAACLLLPMAYSVFHQAAHRPASGPARPAHAGNGQPHTAMALEVMPAPYQLPLAISREVVLAGAGGLLIAGGLTPSGASVNTVTRLDPVTGATRVLGHLAAATHDAAGFTVGGRVYVTGGGTAASVPTIQAFTLGTEASPGVRAAVVGRLARARSDSNGVSAGPVSYVVGGYDGTTLDPQVLATTDGQYFRVAARLSVPVRYAGTATGTGRIWVFGGETAAGPTDVIQRVDPAAGAATVVGHLPQPVQGAVAISLDGQIYIAGGVTAQGTSRTVFQFDPATSRVSVAGELPVPVGYAGAAVIGGVGYLIGGENAARTEPAVTTLRLVAGGQAVPSAKLAPWLGAPAGPGRLAPGSDPSALTADVLVADHHNNRLLIVDPQGRIRWEFPRPGNLAPGQTFLQPDDAFFSPDGKYIVVTQEDNFVISVISMATSTIIYRCGVPGVPGAGPATPIPARLSSSPRPAAFCGGWTASTSLRSLCRCPTATFCSTMTSTTESAWWIPRCTASCGTTGTPGWPGGNRGTCPTRSG